MGGADIIRENPWEPGRDFQAAPPEYLLVTKRRSGLARRATGSQELMNELTAPDARPGRVHVIAPVITPVGDGGLQVGAASQAGGAHMSVREARVGGGSCLRG